MNRLARFSMVVTALAIVGANPAFAQSEQQKSQQVEKDNRDIRHDKRDIRKDKADIARDRAKLNEERKERNFDQAKEDQAIKSSNLKAAQAWDARRRQEQKEINALKKDLAGDKAGLGKDRKDVQHDIAKRNRDASKL
jgi:hypothetical protein